MATKLTAIPTFRTDDGRTVQFFPVTDQIMRLTSTHRVVIDGLACGWLSVGYKPTAKVAKFFLKQEAA